MDYRKLKPTAFHYGMRAFYGKEAQVNKVIEELIELQHALTEKDIKHIIEECADVEVVLPYIEVVFQIGTKPTVKPARHRYNYNDVSNILITMLEVRKTTGSSSFDIALRIMVEHLAYSLFCLYEQLKINREDIENVKNEKYRRTIVRTVNKIIGG